MFGRVKSRRLLIIIETHYLSSGLKRIFSPPLACCRLPEPSYASSAQGELSNSSFWSLPYRNLVRHLSRHLQRFAYGKNLQKAATRLKGILSKTPHPKSPTACAPSWQVELAGAPGAAPERTITIRYSTSTTSNLIHTPPVEVRPQLTRIC